jgi:hypothetical protein
MTISTHDLQVEAEALAVVLNEKRGSTSDHNRLVAILDLRVEVGPEEWENGVRLIPEDEFEAHARDEAETIGAISSEAAWPCNCIDWERAARELKMDYRCVQFEGMEYLFPAI